MYNNDGFDTIVFIPTHPTSITITTSTAMASIPSTASIPTVVPTNPTVPTIPIVNLLLQLDVQCQLLNNNYVSVIHNNHRIFDVPTASKCPTISGGTNTLTITPTPNPTSITAITTLVFACLSIFIVVRTILVVNNNPVCHLSNYSGTKSYGAHNTTTTISGEFSLATARPNTLTISTIT